jgi:hypothetical protein
LLNCGAEAINILTENVVDTWRTDLIDCFAGVDYTDDPARGYPGSAILEY